MGSIIAILPVVLRRVSSNARLLLAVVIGAVLAPAIMSTTAIYTDAIRDLGLSFALRERPDDEINLAIRSSSQTGERSAYERNQEYIESQAEARFGGILEGDATALGRSSTFFPTEPGGSVAEDDSSRDRSHFVFVTGLEDHIEVLQGVLPPDTTAPSDIAPSIDVAVGAETAARLGIELQRELDLHPFWAPEAEPIKVRVTAIIEATDPEEEFWVNQDELFSVQTPSWDTIPLFISRETFLNAVLAYLPNMTSDYTTLLYIDTSRINARNADPVRFSIDRYGDVLASNVVRSSLQTELPEVLATYDEKLFFTRVPLLVLVLQIAAIVLYYLFMVSTMLVERQAGEIAQLKSRGATTAQVMRIYVVEGLAVMLLALALGPPLAATVISFLGQTPPFADLSGGSNLEVTLSGEAYLWALGGAALAFVTLLFPAYQATRRTVVQQRAASSRPPKQAAFTRYYLDVVLVVLAGILLYQLDRQGSLVSSDFFGDQSVDPVVLLTPAFFMLTVGLVFLRLFPLVLRLLAWTVSRAQGASVLIGMWQLVRNPVHYSRLVLLLMLATAVGTFSSSFGATLDRSYADRAAYEAGSDVRIAELREIDAAGSDLVNEYVTQEFGVEHSSQVYRLTGSQGDIVNRTSFSILGVEPETFGEVSSFRPDFAADSLDSLLEELGPSLDTDGYGLPLPADARWLGIWINPIDMPSSFGLEMKLRDATGRYFDYVVGPEEVVEMEAGWNLLVSDLTREFVETGSAGRRGFASFGPYAVSEPQTPLTLTSILLRSPTRFAAPAGTLQFDDLHVSAADDIDPALAAAGYRHDPARSLGGLPGSQVLASFDSPADWRTLQGLLPFELNDSTSTVAGDGVTALEMTWQPQPGRIDTRGLIPAAAGVTGPLPVLASDAFLAGSGLQVGDTTQLFVTSMFFEAQIVGSFGLFPTLGDTRIDPALVTNGSMLGATVNTNPRGPLTYPNELWITGSPSALAAFEEQGQNPGFVGQVVSVAQLADAQQSDPLVAAGWEGILFISFAAILVLSAIGFLIYSYLTAQRRTLEFAVLRTMGFSKRQIALVVGFEQVFVIGLGMIAGTLMGMRLGGLMIRYMGLTETGENVLPPMQLHLSWLTIGSAWLVLAAVFLVTIGAVVLLYSRLALHRVLRIGEA